MSETSELRFDGECDPTSLQARGDDASRSTKVAQPSHASTAIMAFGRPEPDVGGEAVVDPGIEWTGALLDALTDQYSRKIVGSAVARGMAIDEICSEQQIPPSSCYRKVKRLVDQGLMIVETRVVTSGGKKYTIYRSTFSYISVNIEAGAISARVVFNQEIVDKLSHRPVRRVEKRERQTRFFQTKR
jgi:hypothetical protein